jgi:GNAT superfamily N-acetyltransferase
MTISIREVKIEDAEGIANVGVKTWQSTYKGIFPAEKLEQMSLEENTERWKKNITNSFEDENIKILVAEGSNEGIVGWVGGGKYERTPPFDCEIAGIYVLEEFQDKGIGTQFVNKISEFFSSMNWKTMVIWIVKDNPYCRFYEKLGGLPKEKKMYEVWGTEYELVGYVWDDVNKIKQK